MKKRILCTSLSIAVVLVFVVGGSAADARPRDRELKPARTGEELQGAAVATAKAAGDTILLMGPQGSGATYIGDFEGPGGAAAWNGWTSVDESVSPVNPWHVDSYRAVDGGYSAWCGEARFPSCGPGDPDGGYGNDYNAVLEWRGAVADPGQPCTATVSAVANLDTEPGYDYAYLQVGTAAGDVELWAQDGQAAAQAVGGVHVYQPGDYVGTGGDEVVVRFRVRSDGIWSDEDCMWPSGGAMQLDDVVIALSNGAGASHDFEDGTLGPFTAVLPVLVGDFAQLWTGLEDLDPCATNYTPQAAFIDDGLVVPGTGGAPCWNWCYGPFGWIVNTTGGLAGPDEHIQNSILSPVMAWPDPALDGARLSFDVYEHEDLGPDSPGMFWVWFVRSAVGTDPADLEAAPWESGNYVYYGGPGYERVSHDVSDLLVDGLGQVQIKLGVWELGWFWGWVGGDGYPAPYFDNVRFEAAEAQGPLLKIQERHLAQDAFPEAGEFDPAAPGAAHVRFDMAENIDRSNAAIIPGDSVVIDAGPAHADGELAGVPELRYRLWRNTSFDPWRTSGLPDVGAVVCDSVRALGGTPIEGRWSADLPDTGFLYPGDVLHYYFSATEVRPGGSETALLPADTTGFSAQPYQQAYDHRFTVRALPSLALYGGNPSYAGQPPLLVWFDGAESVEQRETWRAMLSRLCLDAGYLVDLFTTRAPSAGLDNGLGSRATVDLLAGYHAIVYTCGDLRWSTLGVGDGYSDLSADVQLLEAWLNLGSRGFYAGGSHLAADLDGSVVGRAFLNEWFGASWFSDDIRPLIGAQTAPVVMPVGGSGVFFRVEDWVVDGGCPGLSSFDAVTAVFSGIRQAEFTTPSGYPGGYPYAAAVGTWRTLGLGAGSRALLTPWSLTHVRAGPAGSPSGVLQTRTALLADLVEWSGIMLPWDCWGDVPTPPESPPLAVKAQPNPANPQVRISYTVPRAGRLTLKIYDVRGRFVRQLLDENVEAPGHLDWDGTDGEGRAVASGVYFYEARMDNERQVGKLALIR